MVCRECSVVQKERRTTHAFYVGSLLSESSPAAQHTFTEHSGHKVLEVLWLRKDTAGSNYPVLGRICDCVGGGYGLHPFQACCSVHFDLRTVLSDGL